MKLIFVTSNENKYNEAKCIFSKFNIDVIWHQLEYPEIQSMSIEQIAEWSAKYVYSVLKKPLFLEDTGLFIDALSGFPGPYSSYVYKTIGNEGILKLMNGVANRKAYFLTVVAYVDENGVKLFKGRVNGVISKSIRGTKWGFDPIFIPEGMDKTYSELGEIKNKISHRKKAYDEFINWLLEHKRK